MASAKQIAMRACATLSEYMKPIVHWKRQNMDTQEANWMTTFQLKKNHIVVKPSTSTPKWALHLSKEAFQNW